MKTECNSIWRSCLIFLIFITNIITDASVSDFYYSNGIQKNWDDAKLHCSSMGMELAMLDTVDKHNAAKTYINTFPSTNEVWFGLSLDQTCYPPYVYKYLSGLAPTYLPWEGWSEPDDQTTDVCIRLARSSGFGFRTMSCSRSYDFLCTPVTGNNSSQQPYTTKCDTTTTQTNLVTFPDHDSTIEAGDTSLTEYDKTTILDTTPGQEQYGGLLDCLCPCSNYTNKWLHLLGTSYTLAELKQIMQPYLDEMTDNLKVDYKNTSKYRRSITSAVDSRKSSFAMGTVGIVVLSLIGCLIFALDCTNVVKLCRQSYGKRRKNVVGMKDI